MSPYTKNVKEGTSSVLAQFASDAARAFFFDIDKIPRTADELLKKQGTRDFDKEIKELNDELVDHNVDKFLEKIKTKKEELEKAIHADLEQNERLNKMAEMTKAWYPPTEMMLALKDFMLEQINQSYNDVQHYEKQMRFLNTVLEQHVKDPNSFNLQYTKDYKNRRKIIEDTIKEKEAFENIAKETQKWLDQFYTEFPSLVEKQASKKKENA